MNKKQKDRHLDVPAEANRDKHVNFVAQERGEEDPSTSPDSDKLINKNKEDRRGEQSRKRDHKKK